MPDDFSKWGLSPGDVSDTVPSQGLSEQDFNSKWLNEQQPSNTVPSQSSPITNMDRLGQVISHPYEAAKPFATNITNPEIVTNTIPAIAHSIAQGITSPGNAWYSTPKNPVTTEQMVEPATNLAGIIGTGAIPSVFGAGKALIDPAAAQLANLAREKFGIPIRGGQISESPSVNYLDSVLKGKPFSGYGENVVEQHSSFNRAVAKTIGEDADKVTPEVMANAKSRLGQNYEDIASQTTLKLDDKMGEDFNRIASDAQSVLAPNERSIVHSQIQNILDKAQGIGEIDGKTFQAIIKTGSPLDRATKSADTNVKYYAGQIKSSLIDAMGRSAPEDMQTLLKQTNSQYKAMKTIEDLAEKSPTGDISPSLLMGAVRKSYPNMAYGGGGDLADLARIGQRFLKEPPQSGTQPRFSAAQLLGMGGAGGAEALLAFHDPIMAAKVAAFAAAAGTAKAGMNKGIGSILRSDWYANHLINSALPSQGGTTNMLQKLTNSTMPYLPPAIPRITIPVPMQPSYPQQSL